MSFSFSFSGDDIEDSGASSEITPAPPLDPKPAAAAKASAFPVFGKSLLPAIRHDLQHMLSELPSKVAFGVLDVELDGSGTVHLPRRELWDVRVQLMAEEGSGADMDPGLGSHDVKTGVYEGGFKSWESSVDLVKTLALSKDFVSTAEKAARVIELGCGTGLPSLALFQWACILRTGDQAFPLSLVLADYNPTVLQLVTLPNFILCWALTQQETSPLIQDALAGEGELDLTPEVLAAFQEFLSARNISLDFLSGGWSEEFVNLILHERDVAASAQQDTIILGAETIYSPFALNSFIHTIFSLMKADLALGNPVQALVGAKKLYFGVGGSLDDFIVGARELGATVDQVREETEGVRRGVVRVTFPG